MNPELMPILWVAITMPLLFIFQRWIHRHLHGVAYLLTGNHNWAVIVYAIVLFPGVLLHEISHWLVAQLVGVRTGSFSVLPKTKPDGTVQLGYVEYYKTRSVGPIRESLIGSAPLISGTVVILLISFHIFDVTALASAVRSGEVDRLAEGISVLFSTNDFLLWLYLLFAVGNAMMPSAADRRAWPAFLLILGLFAIILFLLGLGDDIVAGLAGPLATVFGYLGMAFSLAIGVDLFAMLVIFVVEWIVSRIKGVDLVYGRTGSLPPGS